MIPNCLNHKNRQDDIHNIVLSHFPNNKSWDWFSANGSHNGYNVLDCFVCVHQTKTRCQIGAES